MLKRLRISRYLALVGVLLLALVMVSPAPAPATEGEVAGEEGGPSTLEEYLEQEKELQASIKQIEKDIAARYGKLDELKSQVVRLDAQIEVLKLEIQAAEQAIAALDLQIDAAILAIEEATVRLNERQAYLESRIYEIYVNGDVTMLDVFFNAGSFEEFLVMYDWVERIMVKDKEVLDQIFYERSLIEDEKAKLQSARNDQQTILDSLEVKSGDLKNLQAQKVQAASEEQKTIAELEEMQRIMEETYEATKDWIREWYANNTSKHSFGGVFYWPLPANQTNITSEYGMREHPILGGQRMHAGIDIGAPNGTAITPAAPGTVMFIGWYGGYGMSVIIDHGDQVSTLYAHMSAYGGFQAGDYVTITDEIGYVGSTGQSTGNHLHFEVRVNGAHTNPWAYLK